MLIRKIKLRFSDLEDAMEFIPTNEYMEVSLQEGLNALQIGRTDKLFSDGLDD